MEIIDSKIRRRQDGGTAEYFRLDGTNTRILYSKPINIVDDNVLQIGNSLQDLRLFHDGTQFIHQLTRNRGFNHTTIHCYRRRY